MYFSANITKAIALASLCFVVYIVYWYLELSDILYEVPCDIMIYNKKCIFDLFPS